jgi:hypothetical protein
MAIEFQTLTSKQFFRLGAHGELDWPASLRVLSTLVKSFGPRGTDLALLDLRDTESFLTQEQIAALVHMLDDIGFSDEKHRVAILHRPLPKNRGMVFVYAAKESGFDFADFVEYEKAVEWLSRIPGADPHFDREIYTGGQNKDPGP